MSASMRRMNGIWRGMSVALVLCALLLNRGVVCQDEGGDAPPDAVLDASADPTGQDAVDPTPEVAAPAEPANTDATHAPADTGATLPADAQDVDTSITDAPDAAAAPDAPDTAATPGPSDSQAGETLAPIGTAATPGEAQDSAVSVQTAVLPGGAEDDTTGTTAGPVGEVTVKADLTAAVDPPAVDPPADPEVTAAPTALVVPVVECVDKEVMKDRDYVKVMLAAASNCEDAKRQIESLPGTWGCTASCNLQISMEEGSKELLMASPDTGVKQLAETLNAEGIKGALGVEEVDAAPQQTGYVLPTLLTLGLLLAGAIIGAYLLKNRSHSAKGMRLAEDSYPADEENQGNTLVSVAPLVPQEPQEKPSTNGEALDGPKTQPPPPTNGHSTPKTPVADTEL